MALHIGFVPQKLPKQVQRTRAAMTCRSQYSRSRMGGERNSFGYNGKVA